MFVEAHAVFINGINFYDTKNALYNVFFTLMTLNLSYFTKISPFLCLNDCHQHLRLRYTTRIFKCTQKCVRIFANFQGIPFAISIVKTAFPAIFLCFYLLEYKLIDCKLSELPHHIFTMAKWGEGDPRWIVEERADATNVNNWHWFVLLVMLLPVVVRCDLIMLVAQASNLKV